MKIHEYQGKALFRKAGVPVLEGIMAKSADEAVAAYEKLGGAIAVVKAQIHAGGRGKGTVKDNASQRGVVVCKSADEVRAAAEGLLGNVLVTIQTGEEGKQVNQIFVEAGCDIARELYCGIVIDRAAMKPVLMVSTEGGVEIEEVAEKTPELIFKEHFDPAVGLEAFQVRKLCKKLAIEGAAAKHAAKFLRSICRFFVDFDCALCEINPLVITGNGEMIALDAKIDFDSNALFRHKDLLELRDLSEEEPSEVRASESGLSYVKLEGNIGCLVNGAGLAMSTM
ncbi:MAG: ATP-grasp domain-containing protein, partial [Planctomycetota bacterium]